MSATNPWHRKLCEDLENLIRATPSLAGHRDETNFAHVSMPSEQKFRAAARIRYLFLCTQAKTVHKTYIVGTVAPVTFPSRKRCPYPPA